VNPNFDGQLPHAMATGAAEVDGLYIGMFWFSVIFTVLITGLTLYWVVKYKRKKGDVAEAPIDLTKLEIAWTILPIFFIIVLFHLGFKGWVHNAVAADGAIELRVRAKQWLWDFEYPNGMRENNVILMPVNRPVKMIMSSDDVLHSFYIPEFRMKRDVVPGMYTTVTFTPNVLGEAHVFCAEYCGTGHSAMLATVKIVTEQEYDSYIKVGPKNPNCQDDNAPCPEALRAKWGEALFVQNACTTCHARDGVTKSQGPNLKGKFGHMESFEATPNYAGASTMIDENYVKESIKKPQAKIVKGYTQVLMPTFALTDRQVDALIAYIKSLQ
jgi:cytochrome c oxidase subunit 2